MKSSIFAAAVLALCLSAHAEDWDPIGESVTSFVLLDRPSIKQQGQYIKAWVMYENKTPQKYGSPPITYSSMKRLQLVDCKSDRMGFAQQHLYSETGGRGELVSSQSLPYERAQIEDVIPGTIGEIIFTQVCLGRSSATTTPPHGQSRSESL